MIPTHPFGRTGHESARVLFGGAALGACAQAEADAALERARAHGINHIDTARGYGESEVRIGAWLQGSSEGLFIATKTRERTYAAAREQIRDSLRRLGLPRVDLLQLHNLVEPEEWEVALGPDGALRAAVEAREEGLVRFIGVTGHGLQAPAMHLRSLERFDFDSVLVPCNYVLLQNPQYRSDFEALLAACAERDVAVQTIKSIARGPWGEGQAQTRRTWYEPLEEPAAIERAVHWVLSWPGVFLNMVGDTALQPHVLAAAASFQAAPPEALLQDDLAAGITPLFT